MKRLALLYYINQYITRYVIGKYTLDRCLSEISWSISSYKKKVKKNEV